jgi:uncharacterized protein Smg (DUF494 family)
MRDDSFFEIIMFLVERFSEAHPQNWELDEATAFLQDVGYDNSEIKRAISWFFLQAEPDPVDAISYIFKRSPSGFRVLSPHEMSRITPEAHGYLLEMKQLGVIDDDSLEDVVDSALAIGDAVVEREDLVQIVDRMIHGFGEEEMNKARKMVDE